MHSFSLGKKAFDGTQFSRRCRLTLVMYVLLVWSIRSFSLNKSFAHHTWPCKIQQADTLGDKWTDQAEMCVNRTMETWKWELWANFEWDSGFTQDFVLIESKMASLT